MASVKNTKFQRTERVENGSHALGVFYNKSATGLNYVIASVLTTTRPTWQPGSGFPANLIVSGLPAGATVTAAFLYAGLSYTETSAPLTVAAGITNPNSIVTNYNDSLIGSDVSVCWGETCTAMYRCLVNSCITGNGTYQVNITGLNDPAWEVDGLSLLIVYIDNTASYTGTLLINDGIESGVQPFNDSITGFTGCTSVSTNAQAFVLAADIQSNTSGPNPFPISLNSTVHYFPRNFWDVYAGCTTVDALQTVAKFSIDSAAVSADCYFVGMCGLYFQPCSTNNPCILGIPVSTKISSIVVYPNPVKNTLLISMHRALKGSLGIFNVLGEQVYSCKISSGTGTTLEKIDISNIPSGIYILTIESGGQRLNEKLIKL